MRAAFTLAEILLSIAMLSVIFTAMGVAVQASMSSYDLMLQRNALAQAERSLTQRITREIRQAEDISVSSNRLFIYPVQSVDAPDRIRYRLNDDGRFTYQKRIDGNNTNEPIFDDLDRVSVTRFEVSVTFITEDSTTYPGLVTVEIDLATEQLTRNAVISATPRMYMND